MKKRLVNIFNNPHFFGLCFLLTILLNLLRRCILEPYWCVYLLQIALLGVSYFFILFCLSKKSSNWSLDLELRSLEEKNWLGFIRWPILFFYFIFHCCEPWVARILISLNIFSRAYLYGLSYYSLFLFSIPGNLASLDECWIYLGLFLLVLRCSLQWAIFVTGFLYRWDLSLVERIVFPHVLWMGENPPSEPPLSPPSHSGGSQWNIGFGNRSQNVQRAEFHYHNPLAAPQLPHYWTKLNIGTNIFLGLSMVVLTGGILYQAKLQTDLMRRSVSLTEVSQGLKTKEEHAKEYGPVAEIKSSGSKTPGPGPP